MSGLFTLEDPLRIYAVGQQMVDMFKDNVRKGSRFKKEM